MALASDCKPAAPETEDAQEEEEEEEEEEEARQLTAGGFRSTLEVAYSPKVVSATPECIAPARGQAISSNVFVSLALGDEHSAPGGPGWCTANTILANPCSLSGETRAVVARRDDVTLLVQDDGVAPTPMHPLRRQAPDPSMVMEIETEDEGVEMASWEPIDMINVEIMDEADGEMDGDESDSDDGDDVDEEIVTNEPHDEAEEEALWN